MIPLSINSPRAIIIPVIEVIWSGKPISLQPIITRQIENGSIKVTMIAGLNPKIKKLILRTKKVAKEKLFIYELLLRDFVARHDFQTLKDTLNYLQNLGVNAIELMPVNEFEGNESWGYNPAFYFAVDKYYGSKNAFKSFNIS